jgi:hypothetical protein
MGDEPKKRGWYADPQGSALCRYYDGTAWTDRLKDLDGQFDKWWWIVTAIVLTGYVLWIGCALVFGK